AGRFAGPGDGRQQQSYQNADDRDDHQQLDECKTTFLHGRELLGVKLSKKRTVRSAISYLHCSHVCGAESRGGSTRRPFFLAAFYQAVAAASGRAGLVFVESFVVRVLLSLAALRLLCRE